LRGWMLDPVDETRVAEIVDAPEVMLQKRPLALFIEVPTANEKLAQTNGMKIYTLKMSVKVWSLDQGNQVRIRRYGFPLVPDFGGTAHAYCGDTVPALIGDLMKWTHIPNLDNALRGYIIKSRIRNSSNLLLAQPYSPMLFRQGEQPGPHLLRERLLDKLTPKEAKQRWLEFHRTKAKEKKSGGTYLSRLLIPCRQCTDNNGGVEVMKPIKAFTAKSAAKHEEIWNEVMRLGQDAICYVCNHKKQKQQPKAQEAAVDEDTNIFCENCCCPKPREFFTKEDRATWDRRIDGCDSILCISCQGSKHKRNPREVEMIHCNGVNCACELPFHYFVEEKLGEWREKGTVAQEAVCARCLIQQQDLKGKTNYPCRLCNETKDIRDFTAVSCKHWLKKDGHANVFVCFDCAFPRCAMPNCGSQHPLTHNAAHNSWVSKSDFQSQASKSAVEVAEIYGDTKKSDKRWFCNTCKYPPCQKQTNPLCLKNRYEKSMNIFKQWTCKKCAETVADCPQCERRCTEDTEFKEGVANLHRSITTLQRLPRRREEGHEEAARFINNAFQNCRCDARRAVLEALPHWEWPSTCGQMRETRASEHAKRIDALEAHVREHGSLPKQKTELGRWYNNISKAKRWKSLSKEEKKAIKKCKDAAKKKK